MLVHFETMCKYERVAYITDGITRPNSRSAGVLNGARPSSALASVMSFVMTNPGLLPISIEPSIGAIEPSAMQNFSIRFSPLEVAQFQARLVCRYSNKEFCCKNRNVLQKFFLKGINQYHFDLQSKKHTI